MTRMLILLRKIRIQNEKVVDQRDDEVEANVLNVGSDKAQDLQLFGREVAPRHCVLQLQPDGRLHIECRGQHQVTVAAGDVGRTDVGLGEWVQIGRHRLALVAPPPGFDAAIEVRIDIEATESIEDRLREPLTLKLPPVRRYSYLLALLVLLAGLGLPLLGYYNSNADAVLKESSLPSDLFWSSGPLSDPHHLPGMAENCKACHQQPFERVPNRACLECHADTTAHFAPAHPVVADFNERCSSCHKEHNEPANLVVEDKRLCTDCHSDSQQRLVEAAPAVGAFSVGAAPADIKSVRGFGQDLHPQFLVALLRASGQGWSIRREPLDAGATEASHLKFPHDVHLDSDKVSAADGLGADERALVCRDCHQLERDGEHFAPITMESTCVACHSLAFDQRDPGRQPPHGQPAAVRTYLEEFYVKLAAQQRHGPPTKQTRRVPGSQPERHCSGDPLQCGLRWAEEEMELLFTKTGCVSCHEVSRQDDEWRVAEVRLARDWYPGARFDHRPHLNPGVSQDEESCLDCHQAGRSSTSKDVLMPGLEYCVDCHGEARHAERRVGNIPLQCIDCHGFHRSGLTTMKEL